MGWVMKLALRIGRYGSGRGILALALLSCAGFGPCAWAFDPDAPVEFHIAPQKLANALVAFSHQANVQVVSASSDLGEASSPGIDGRLSPRLALKSLLSWTHLQYQLSGAGVVAVGYFQPTEPRGGEFQPTNLVVAQATTPPPPQDNSGAQSNPPPTAAAASAALEEITITGTHLASGYNSPTPVTVVDSQLIESRAPANVLEVLNQIPQFRPSQATSGNDRLSLSQSGVEGLVDLRGLGPTRTLTLVDGERFVGGNVAGLVDTNMLPLSLIDHVEVVTGGASAAYGSDAVSGVVNFKLKDRMDGIVGSVQGGQSEFGDDKQWVASLAGGTNFFDDRAHLVVGLDYAKNEGVGTFYTRPYGNVEAGLITAGNGRPAGVPAQIWSNGVELSNATPGGLILSGALKGTAFNGSGSPYDFNYGTVYSSNMVGSTANYGNNPQGYALIGVPFDRESLYSKFSFDITDTMSAFISGNLGVTASYAVGGPPTSIGPITIGVTNPYIPASVASAMVADGLTSISVGKIFSTVGGNWQQTTDHLSRIAAGLKGEVFGDWHWDIYGATGETKEYYRFNGIDSANIDAASDAVLGANGAVTCAPTATNPNLNAITRTYVQSGCSPFDIFGISSPATQKAAYAYMFHQIYSVEQIKQHSAAANLAGSPVNDWAGPVQIGVGAEYRWDGLYVNSDPIGAAGEYYTSGQADYQGSNSTKEAYLEAGVPLVKDGLFTKSLDLNLAGRYTDYQIEGSVETWKLGLTDDIDDDWRLRVTRSHDIRAPNLFDLFGVGPPAIQVNINNPFNGTSGNLFSVQSGNLNLKPESAESFTGGVVFAPKEGWARNFKFSVDYFDIKLTDAIASGIGVQSTINGCYAGIKSYCSLIDFDSSAVGIHTVALQSINLNKIYTNGLDFEAEYRQPTMPFGVPGALDLHLLGTFTNHMSLTTAAGVVNYAGSAATIGSAGTYPNGGGVPTWHGDLTVTYHLNPVTTQLQFTGFTRLTYNPTLIGPDSPLYNPALSNSISQNQFAGLVYTNLTATYQARTNMQLFAVIDNVFDRWPPTYALNAFSTNAADYYDTVGRSFKVGFRFRL
jgi:iron complex outermembrane recepter protein